MCFIFVFFFPLLLQQSFNNTDKEIKVIADLIEYYTWLFGVSDEEITKEKEIDEKYRDGLAKFKQAQQAAVSLEFNVLLFRIDK